MSPRFLPTLGLALLLAVAASAEPPSGVSEPDRELQAPPSPGRVRVEKRLHRFRHLEGTYRTEDSGLRATFERTAEALVELQIAELKVEAKEFRDRERERTQRRTPPGAIDQRDIEPAHIPAVVLARLPL